MMNKFQEVKIEEVDVLIPDKDTIEKIKKEKPPIFRMVDDFVQKDMTTDPLVDLEITLRKGERIGFFKK
ncbi:MAG: hypothetical protein HQ539_00255 [Parcubacteria group bacterium]|nr:hypothetical protein [Parcubacteria group bacterium]